jgi:hypothetical protein
MGGKIMDEYKWNLIEAFIDLSGKIRSSYFEGIKEICKASAQRKTTK